MTRRRKILLLTAGGLIAVVAVCFFCLREKEPSYNGRTLSEWLEDAKGGISVTEQIAREEAIQAVGKIGTNAIPLLLKWEAAKDSTLEIALQFCEERIPTRYARSFGKYVWDRSAERKHRTAYYAFGILGTNAAAALPQLEGRYMQTIDKSRAADLKRVIISLGSTGLPFFIDVIQRGGTNWQRELAIVAIGDMPRFGTDVTPAIPVLLNLVTNNDRNADLAIDALAKLNVNANTVVPAVMNQLNSTNRFVRHASFDALRQYGTNAQTAVPVLKQLLDSKDFDTRQCATTALFFIVPGMFKFTNSSSPTGYE